MHFTISRYWMPAVCQTLRDTDNILLIHSMHRYWTPTVCAALEVLKCIIHSFTHWFTVQVLSTSCGPGIHPLTLHILMAYWLLNTWFCPARQQPTGQPEALTSRNFNLHFWNHCLIVMLGPHHALRKEVVIFMSTLKTAHWGPKEMSDLSRISSLLPPVENIQAWCRRNAVRTGGPGWMKENLPRPASLSSSQKLPSQNMGSKPPDYPAFQKPTTLFIFIQNMAILKQRQLIQKSH